MSLDVELYKTLLPEYNQVVQEIQQLEQAILCYDESFYFSENDFIILLYLIECLRITKNGKLREIDIAALLFIIVILTADDWGYDCGKIAKKVLYPYKEYEHKIITFTLLLSKEIHQMVGNNSFFMLWKKQHFRIMKDKKLKKLFFTN